MKTTTTLKQLALVAFAAATTLTACKKDDLADPEPEPDPIEVVQLGIADLKALSTGESVTIGEENKIFRIKGIVISDKDAANISAETAVLQEANNQPGIVVNFTSAHDFALGEEVEVGVSNQKLKKVGGEIVLDAIPLDSAKSLSTGNSIAARTATAEQVVENAEAWNGTLVTIGEGTLSGGGGKLSGTLDYTDETGTVKVTVLEDAAFQGEDYQASARSLTGLVRIKGDEVHVDIRRTSDVVGLYAFVWTEDFEGITTLGQFTDNTNSRSFKTNLGTWKLWLPGTDYVLANRQLFLDANNDFADKDLLESDKKYFYLPYNSKKSSNHSFITDFADSLKGVTSITFRVALSRLEKLIFLQEGANYGIEYGDFSGYDETDPQHGFHLEVLTDGIPVGVTDNIWGERIWHTVTADLSEVNSGTDFHIVIKETGNPVVFDRISFNYETKPDWAE